MKRKGGGSAVSVSHDAMFQRLSSWLATAHGHQGQSAHMRPAVFSDTGRGLQALGSLSPGDTIVNIPITAVVSRARVIQEFKTNFKDGSHNLISTQVHSQIYSLDIMIYDIGITIILAAA